MQGGGSAAGGLRILKSEEHVGGVHFNVWGYKFDGSAARNERHGSAPPARDQAVFLPAFRRVPSIFLSIYLEMELRQEAA